MGRFVLLVGLLLALLAGGAWLLGRRQDDLPAARWRLAESVGGDAAEGFAIADRPRAFAFPADHGPHPDFRVEWWYFTGNLAGEDGRRFGYQLTFFRRAVAPAADGAAERESAWATRQVYLAHLAVTDQRGRRFAAFERLARGAVGLAGAEAEPFRVWVEGWRAESAGGAAGGVFPLRLTAADDGVALDLLLATAKPPVLRGDDGLSVKGPGRGNASYYYSLTRLPTRGTLTLGGERFAVSGLSWLDREWSTTLLGPGERGWDWLALQLDDGREVSGWRIRRAGAAPDRLDALAVVEPDGTLRPLDPARHRLLASSPWESPTGARYPTAWRLSGPGLDLALAALLPDQELRLSIHYWEGAVTARGTLGGRPVGGRGYVEMTGYGAAD
ncbi:MAG TPA: lipocalin-like domain-containing protein [Thermoanaerobaculia bacterium]|nr:lipocalin-like domain-containing protein [Thermoanaerobaculia bacterium]